MPIHPAISSKLHLLEGIRSFEEGMADPVTRARMDEFMSISDAPAPPDAQVHDDEAPGPHGPVPVRVYRPSPATARRPCLVWMHGGAFMAGDLDMPEADSVARELAHRAGAVVVCVDYRLAVDGVTYPVPHDDVVAAFRWVARRGGALGIDPDAIAIGGASAGANLAAGAALRLRDDGRRLPAACCWRTRACTPCCRRCRPSSPRMMTEVPRLLRFLQEDRDWITGNYLGGPGRRRATRWRRSPTSPACAR